MIHNKGHRGAFVPQNAVVQNHGRSFGPLINLFGSALGGAGKSLLLFHLFLSGFPKFVSVPAGGGGEQAESVVAQKKEAATAPAAPAPTDDAPIVVPALSPGSKRNAFLINVLILDGLSCHFRDR